MDETIVSAFAAALGGRDAVATDAATLAENGRDYWGFGQQPGLVLRPRTREEVVAIVKVAAEHNVSLVTRGGASNCSAGVMAGSDRVVIDMTRMNQVLDIDPAARTARVQPGVINSDLQEQLAPHKLVFSPDPVSAHLATVGGNIVENAGGPHALKYGVTYNHVVAVEAVLADGAVLQFRADDDGPDLLGVLIGSEGTLAILTEATVALRPTPPVTRSLMGSFNTARKAAETIAAIIQTGTVPAAVEWLDRVGIAGLQQFTDTGYPADADAIVLIDVDGTADEVDRDAKIVEEVLRQHAVEVRRADDDDARAKLWYGRLHAPDAVVRSGKGFFIGDVTVPRQHIPEMQQAIQDAAKRHSDALLFIAVTGHAGDGDLHPTTFYDKDNPNAAAALEAANNEIIEAALKLGGTITGEHGVGTEKIQFMTKRFTPVEIAAQRILKQVFDPAQRLNPGIMLPDVSPAEPALLSFETAVRAALDRHPGSAAQADGDDTSVEVNTGNLNLVVGAAVTLDELSKKLDEEGVTCAAIPTEKSERTVGELIANAAGEERLAVRHGLLGVEVVLPDGAAVARFGGQNMKDVAGYDTKRLFIGGRNAFGAITSAVFKIAVAR
ncbi:FAD-binding oxidoreductase [Mycolicibacterium aubagnense]|uniref:FAD-binding protein n=1 Tax=Mycolicibacterium aubagnense TaxID=319707 RepID=A0ABM7I7X9_9MYCO|nr:FAD-linked oxidase C-terminal domain-containing protein [Mycolicibacterium aubagnense]TLH62240.1 FAD-binding oxidoreductase [Mycolicibacterium aubagnense]WGI30462.1 FAD-linked oxidase C-terminal domain-containing protein [Mycolicibacterium aubagnense]BBX82636.1 FAD-binding protein [Mycolicibacterium aubagnense]